MILVTSDFLCEKIQVVNYHSAGILPFFSKIIKLTNKKVATYPNDFFSPKYYFDPRVFFNLSGFDYHNNLPPLLNLEDLSERSLSYFLEKFGGVDIVVGWELMPLTIKLFELAGIKYINIWLHPVRFMDDEIFSISSNCQEFSECFNKIKISESSFFVNAEYCKAVARRRSPLQIEENSAAIFGQVSNDKTLRTNDGYLSITKNYINDVKIIAEKHRFVYFCKHPFQKDDSEFDALKRRFPNFREFTGNGYAIISDPNIKTVAMISSSIGIEAYYFEKNVVFFNKPTVNIKNENSYSVGEDIFDPNYWIELLGSNVDKHKGRFLFGGKNKVRNILDAYYSYGILKDL